MEHIALEVAGGGPVDCTGTIHRSIDTVTGTIAKGSAVTFRELTYTVQNSARKAEKLQILSAVTGFFQPKQLAAIMGPSGSGKSTLLDVLSGRKTTGSINGEICYDGIVPTTAFMRRHIGYVEQFDTLLSELSVQEMFLYTAELKRSFQEPRAVKERQVEELLDKLALRSCKDVVIGDALSRGISGGQAKRVNVGIALITDPLVLALDEPTSGLDSFTSQEVMCVVKALADEGMTVFCTIHCPTPQTFHLFERILLLQCGKMAYFGPQGEAVLQYLSLNMPQVRQLIDGENLADYLIDLATTADRQGHSNAFVEAYEHSRLRLLNNAMLEELAATYTQMSTSALTHQDVKSGTTTPWWFALLVLLRFRTGNNYKSGKYLGARVLDKALHAFLICTFFWHVGKNLTIDNVPNIAGVLFIWVLLPAYGACSYVPTLIMERATTVRERNDGLYTALTYLTYKMVEEQFLALVMSITYAVPVYFLCELKGSLVLLWLAYFVTLAAGIASAYMVAALSPNMNIACAALPAYITANIFGAGYLLRWAAIPKYWIWLVYVDWLWYGWGSLMTNQFQGTKAEISAGDDVLAFYKLSGVNAWAFIGYESLFVVAFFFVAWFALVFIRWERR